jgi:penicillin amidase
VNLPGALELEGAGSVSEALDIAHRMGIPHQNLIVGDAQGNIGWTVASALPQRFGHDGRLPTSWTDGTRGWSGYLDPAEVPVVYNPERQRLWTANARVLGGEALNKLGFGAYDHGSRARQIQDSLFAREHFSERDLLAIQLDDRGLRLERWQDLMLQALRARMTNAPYAALLSKVETWGGRALPQSVGYRLVRRFRTELITAVYDAYTAGMPVLEPPPKNKQQPRRTPTNQADEPVWRLLGARPAQLVPPGYRDWEAVIETALSKTLVGDWNGGRRQGRRVHLGRSQSRGHQTSAQRSAAGLGAPS